MITKVGYSLGHIHLLWYFFIVLSL